MAVSKTVWWGGLAVTVGGALAVTLAASGGNAGVAPQLPQHQAAQTQHPAAGEAPVAATAAVQAPAQPAASMPDGNKNTGVDPGNPNRSLAPSPEMLKRAQALRAADLAATRPQGPAEACLAQMKMVFCPIIGNMPFIRDVAGQVAMWGHFDCPTGAPPKG